MESELSNILSAISVILVFLTILFDFLCKEIYVLVGKKKPLEKEDQYKRELLNDYNRTIFKNLMLSIAFLVLAFTLLPTTIVILQNSVFDIWRFDVLKTLFTFIYLFIVLFGVLSVKMNIRLLKRKKNVLSN
jgi:sterol desaturase/sphingolipid hydroxylase (fatty acid hydroxylase superfamily)